MSYLISIGILTGIDLFTKELIRKKLALKEKIKIYKEIFYLYRIENHGIFMGFLKNNKRILNISMISTIGYTAILFFHSLKSTKTNLKIGYAFLLAGGLGNFFDRLKNGCVTDFLHVKYKNLPIFNIADIYIFVGIFIYTLSTFTKKDRN